MTTSFPKEKIRVLLVEGVHPVAKQVFADEGFAVTAVDKALEGAALKKAVAEGGGAHVLGLRSKTQLTREVLEAGGTRLLCAGAFCIGTNQIDLAAARSRGVAVFNSPFSNTRSVAELTVAEVIALHRRLVDQSARMHKGEWDKSSAGAHEVRGRTLGIIGYGHIGSQVSVLAEAMGMRVIFFDTASKLPLGNARSCKSLDEVLKTADVVTLHVPETPVTKGMIGRAQIKAMQRGAMLINNARGSIVDLGALAAAIRDGHLGGAALDVFPHEPAGKDEPFKSEVQGLSNVILTPHVGGSTQEAQENIAQDVVGKLLRFINNGSTTGSVNMPIVDLPEQPGGMGSDGVPTGKRRLHRILHLHRNVPGVMSQVNATMADMGANIHGQYLQTSGEIGYVVLDIDSVDAARSRAIQQRLRDMAETIRVRVLW